MKASKSGRVIGGRSLWGGMFDILMGRYHWTMDYLLWGISYTNVQMLLSDTVQVCYTDMGPTDSRQVISADDPANAGLIRRIINEKE